MSQRIDLPVTLSHADAQAVSRMLQEYAVMRINAAERTKQRPIAAACRQWAREAREQADKIVRSLYAWEG